MQYAVCSLYDAKTETSTTIKKKGSCKQQNLKLADGFKSFASTLTEVG